MFFTNSIIIKVERQANRKYPTVSAKGIGQPVPFALPVGGNRLEVKENMSTQMEKLKAAQEKTLQKLHKAQEEEKQIRKRMAELTRNERTHRLCTRGGYLEKLLIEPELFTDEDVFRFLDYAFGTLYVKDELMKRLEKKRKEAKAAAEKQAAEAAKAEEKVAGNPIE